MKKQLAILIVKKNDDYSNTVVKALEKSGFTVVQQEDGLLENKYIIAEGEEDKE